VARIRSNLPGIGAAPFRFALAVAVLFMLLMQPSAYARSAVSLVDDSASAVGQTVPLAHEGSARLSEKSGARHGHAVEHADHDKSVGHGHGENQAVAEKCCDMQCSPAAWIPSFQDDVTGQPARSFAPAAVEAMPTDAYEAAVRPPRF
jgi:hypothetical protein